MHDDWPYPFFNWPHFGLSSQADGPRSHHVITSCMKNVYRASRHLPRHPRSSLEALRGREEPADTSRHPDRVWRPSGVVSGAFRSTPQIQSLRASRLDLGAWRSCTTPEALQTRSIEVSGGPAQPLIISACMCSWPPDSPRASRLDFGCLAARCDPSGHPD